MEKCSPGAPCADVITIIANQGWQKKIFFSGVFVVAVSALVGGVFTVLTHFEETKQTVLLQEQENFLSKQNDFIEKQEKFNEKVLSAMAGFASSLDNLTNLVYRESRRNDVQDFYWELNRVNDNQVRGELGMKEVKTKPVPLPTFEDLQKTKKRDKK